MKYNNKILNLKEDFFRNKQFVNKTRTQSLISLKNLIKSERNTLKHTDYSTIKKEKEKESVLLPV